jgi:PAS domain S-box-containing protein
VGDSSSRSLVEADKNHYYYPSAHNDEFFHLLAENARDVIFHVKTSPTFQFDYVSPSSTHITGYTPEEFYADPLLAEKCVLPEDFPLVSDPSAWDNATKSKPVEIRWKRKDGRIIWTEHMISVTRDKEGKLESFHIIARDITERKQTEAALRESQQFNESLLENAPHAIVVINPDTSVRYVNPAWVRINGWTLSEVVGLKSPYPWWPAEFRDACIEGFKQAMEQGNGNSEIFAQKKNGEIYWIAMNWVSVMNDGKLAYMIINSVDITDRIMSQEALKESESKYRSIFESANDIIVLLDREGTIIDVNNKVKEIAGFERDELIGHKLNKLSHIMPRNSLSEVIKNFNKRLVGVDIAPYEIEMYKKNGETIFFELSAVPLKINDKIAGDVAILRDITNQKRSMLALKESEEKFSKAFSSSPNSVCIVTVKEGTFLEVNESFLHFSGYSREEVIGHTPAELNLWVNDDDIKTMTKSLKETGRVDNAEIKSRMKSGEIRTGLFSAEEIEIGGRKCITLVITDVTEQKKAEEALANEAVRRRILIEQSSDGIVILDQDGKVCEANQRFADMLGYSMDEMQQLHVFDWEFLYPHEQTIEMIRTVDEKGDHFETQHRRKDGTTYDVEISTNGAMFAGQKLIFCVCRDITERKRAEKVIHESEERFRTLFETMSQGVIYHDSEGRVISANPAAERILGLTPDEMIGKTSLDPRRRRLHEDGSAFTSEEHPPIVALRTGKPVNDIIMAVYNPAEEDYRWIINSAIPEFREGGKKPYRVYTTFTDITERKRIEQSLRESEEKFSKAFNGSPTMMVIVNFNEDKYVEVNDSFVNCLGYSREELIGHTADEFNIWIYPEEKEKMARLMREQGKIRDEEFRFRTKNGEIRTWLCSADTLNIGGVVYMLGASTDITERRKDQEALRESEEKFSKAFRASPSSISISRMSDGKFIEVNDTFLRDKGYTREEVVGHTAKELNIFAKKEDYFDIRATLNKQGKFTNEDIQFRTKSGQIRTGLMSAEIINIGNEPCMIVMHTDITDQKLTQEQLRLLSSVTQQVTDSTVITDPDFNITYINQAAEDMFGYTLDEVKGKKLSIFSKVKPSEATDKAMNKVLQAGKVFTSIITKKRKDGTLLTCDCRLSPLHDEKGQICSLIDVQRDITKQRDVATKLQEHKKLIDSILATMPEGVLVIDSNSQILLANKALYKIFHLNSKSLNNKLLSEILPTDQFFDLHKAVKRGGNEKNTLEFRYQAQKLEKIIYCIIVKMDGERTMLTFSDVSREREEEEKLYLTSRLASLGEMAAGLAHELNNPLTGILALSQLLTSSNLPAEHKEDIECIYGEAKRAASIVKNVLLFARNKTGENGQAPVNEVIKDVLRLREYEERTSNINVVTNFEENLPSVPLEKGQLQQVLLNLISNAEAAIKEVNRPGIITVATQRVNNHVNITFSDNGCGIKKQIIRRIFDPFFTTKEIGKGTGLGLSICYSIIVKHGGKISIKSQVNEGATFTIRLPVVSEIK